MEVFETFKNSLVLFKKTFLPLFMITSIFPLLELIIRPTLDNYLILNSFSVFDLVSFILTLLVVAIGYITLDLLYRTGLFNIKEIFARAFEVLWPLFLFQLIWMIFAALISLLKSFPPILVLIVLGGVIYLSVRVSMTVILIIVEKESVAKAFDRSFVMTQGKFWNIFSIFLLLSLTVFMIMLLVFLGVFQPMYQVQNIAQLFELLKVSMEAQFVFYVFTMTIVSQLIYVTMYMVYLVLHEPIASKEDPLTIDEDKA